MYTPWGQADYEVKVAPGITWCSTPGHGGFMVAAGVAARMSPEARAEGERYGQYWAFEEDCAWAVVVIERPTIALERLFGKGLDQIVEAARKTAADWLPVYCIRRGLAYNRERAAEIKEAVR